MRIVLFAVFGFVEALFSQSYDLKTEKEKMAKIEAAVAAGDQGNFARQ